MTPTKEAAAKWKSVNDDVFLIKEFAEFKADHYKKDDPRKMKDKAQAVL